MFPSVESALDRSLAAAQHLTDRDAAAVAAARALARKIDAWEVIVDWALDDVEDRGGGRPAVPQNDNVSLASFLKYMEALGLTPQLDKAKRGPESSASPAQQALNDMREQLRVVSM